METTHTVTSEVTDPGVATPPGVAEVIELFRRRQPQLRFPGVDAAALASAVDRLAAAAEQVAAAQLQLDAARRTRAEAEAQLLGACKRAYAYARLFAEDDATLAAELASFRFAKPEKGRPKADVRPLKGQRAKRSDAPAVTEHQAAASDSASGEVLAASRKVSGSRRQS